MTWLAMISLVVLAAMGSAQTVHLWSVDPLTKVFKDDLPTEGQIGPTEVGRGEMAEWQVVLRADAEITNLKFAAGRLRSSAN